MPQKDPIVRKVYQAAYYAGRREILKAKIAAYKNTAAGIFAEARHHSRDNALRRGTR